MFESEFQSSIAKRVALANNMKHLVTSLRQETIRAHESHQEQHVKDLELMKIRESKAHRMLAHACYFKNMKPKLQRRGISKAIAFLRAAQKICHKMDVEYDELIVSNLEIQENYELKLVQLNRRLEYLQDDLRDLTTIQHNRDTSKYTPNPSAP